MQRRRGGTGVVLLPEGGGAGWQAEHGEGRVVGSCAETQEGRSVLAYHLSERGGSGTRPAYRGEEEKKRKEEWEELQFSSKV